LAREGKSAELCAFDGAALKRDRYLIELGFVWLGAIFTCASITFPDIASAKAVRTYD
jgi:hypothetical protein